MCFSRRTTLAHPILDRKRYTNRFFIMSCGLVAMSGVPVAVSIIYLVLDIDGSYFILEEILPSPTIRERYLIYITLLSRFFCNFLCYVEIMRTGSLAIIICIIWMTHVARFIRILKYRVQSGQNFYILHNYLRIMYTRAENFIYVFIYLTLTICFWATVQGAWIMVKARPNIPTFLTLLFAVLGGVVLTGLCTALPEFTETSEKLMDVVQCHLRMQKLMCRRKHTRKNLICLKQLTATNPISLWYGPFWRIGGRFMTEYVELMMLRSFDSVLIFDYK